MYFAARRSEKRLTLCRTPYSGSGICGESRGTSRRSRGARIVEVAVDFDLASHVLLGLSAGDFVLV
ncbi:hypothetical protein RRF57_012115 [Xylaria bambusicola]|uniref:Uncharacterized protein n=1 Tax=Xylaria bambusicola TaxID=326684 RepID=A0AAN7UVZ0_9PEZI